MLFHAFAMRALQMLCVLAVFQLENAVLQNATPAGPASFMFSEIVTRPLRWMDDNWTFAGSFGLHKECLYADQDAYADVLQDMASGYLMFPKAWWCLDEV